MNNNGHDDDFTVVAATGDYAHLKGENLQKTLPHELLEKITSCMDSDENFFEDGVFVRCMTTDGQGEAILLLAGLSDLSDEDRNLLEVFITNVSTAFRNLAHREKD